MFGLTFFLPLVPVVTLGEEEEEEEEEGEGEGEGEAIFIRVGWKDLSVSKAFFKVASD